jgi:putative glutamine amidotransferase
MTPRIAVTRSDTTPPAQYEPYWRRLRDAGLEPVDCVRPDAALDDCAGLVLIGGRDIDPALYHETPHPETQSPNRERDAMELRLLMAAFAAGRPVLAICRGHQLANVCFEGSLLQHIESGAHESLADAEGTSATHAVEIVRDSRLYEALGAQRLAVNSRHHQAVTPDRLGAGLRITALTDDGLVEGFESESHPWLVGVQWHPERIEPELSGFDAAMRRLFASFAAAVHA